MGDVTLSSSAGIQRGDANKSANSSGYGGLALSWYSRDDLKLTLAGPAKLQAVAKRDAPAETVVYNLHVVGNNTCIAGGFYVHNYGNGPTKEEFLASGGRKPPGVPD